MKLLLFSIVCAAILSMGCRTYHRGYQGAATDTFETEYEAVPAPQWTDAKGFRTLPPGQAFERRPPAAVQNQFLEP